MWLIGKGVEELVLFLGTEGYVRCAVCAMWYAVVSCTETQQLRYSYIHTSESTFNLSLWGYWIRELCCARRRGGSRSHRHGRKIILDDGGEYMVEDFCVGNETDIACRTEAWLAGLIEGLYSS